MTKTENDSARLLRELLGERILFLDGAMGTMIQRYKLEEGDFRGRSSRTIPSTSRETTTSSASRART